MAWQEQSLRGNDVPLLFSDMNRKSHAHLFRAIFAIPWRKGCCTFFLSVQHRIIPMSANKMLSLYAVLILFFMPLAGLATPINRPATLYRVINPVPRQNLSPTSYRCWRHYGSHISFRLVRLHTCCENLEHGPYYADLHPRLHHIVWRPSH